MASCNNESRRQMTLEAFILSVDQRLTLPRVETFKKHWKLFDLRTIINALVVYLQGTKNFKGLAYDQWKSFFTEEENVEFPTKRNWLVNPESVVLKFTEWLILKVLHYKGSTSVARKGKGMKRDEKSTVIDYFARDFVLTLFKTLPVFMSFLFIECYVSLNPDSENATVEMLVANLGEDVVFPSQQNNNYNDNMPSQAVINRMKINNIEEAELNISQKLQIPDTLIIKRHGKNGKRTTKENADEDDDNFEEEEEVPWSRYPVDDCLKRCLKLYVTTSDKLDLAEKNYIKKVEEQNENRLIYNASASKLYSQAYDRVWIDEFAKIVGNNPKANKLAAEILGLIGGRIADSTGFSSSSSSNLEKFSVLHQKLLKLGTLNQGLVDTPSYPDYLPKRMDYYQFFQQTPCHINRDGTMVICPPKLYSDDFITQTVIKQNSLEEPSKEMEQPQNNFNAQVDQYILENIFEIESSRSTENERSTDKNPALMFSPTLSLSSSSNSSVTTAAITAVAAASGTTLNEKVAEALSMPSLFGDDDGCDIWTRQNIWNNSFGSPGSTATIPLKTNEMMESEPYDIVKDHSLPDGCMSLETGVGASVISFQSQPGNEEPTENTEGDVDDKSSDITSDSGKSIEKMIEGEEEEELDYTLC